MPNSESNKQKPEYNSWNNMRRRCLTPTTKQYADYGGRGIMVCKRWDSFDNFYADMGPRPTPRHTLERKKNNRGYSKSNCKWATRDEQNNNTRAVRLITHNGKTLTLTEWANETGVPRKLIRARVDRGWPVDQLFTPARTGWDSHDNSKFGSVVYSNPKRPKKTRQVADRLARIKKQLRQQMTLTLDGETRTIIEWARHIGVSVKLIRARRKLGWRTEEILRLPVQKNGMARAGSVAA